MTFVVRTALWLQNGDDSAEFVTPLEREETPELSQSTSGCRSAWCASHAVLGRAYSSPSGVPTGEVDCLRAALGRCQNGDNDGQACFVPPRVLVKHSKRPGLGILLPSQW